MDILGSLNFVLSVVIGLLLLVVLVVVHELGHAIVARRNGVVVEEFGIGFPPRAWAKKLKNGILFTLNWLPLGGFVKLQGENDTADQPGDYGAASYWAKTKILLAGVAINWLTAALLFTVLALVGLPKLVPDQFQMSGDTAVTATPVQAVTVTPDSPAAKAGVQPNDEIVSIGGETIDSTDELFAITKEKKGQQVELVYRHEGDEVEKTITLNPENTGGYLGVGPGQGTTLRSTWSAPIVGVATTAQLSVVTLQYLGDMVQSFFGGLAAQLNSSQSVREAGSKELGELSQSVAGPVGILGVLFPSAREAGIVPLLTVTALVSLTLAIMNILPIPALDGGRFFLMTLFRALRKPLTKEREEKINAIGFMALMALVVLVTISDVRKLL